MVELLRKVGMEWEREEEEQVGGIDRGKRREE